VFLNAGNGRPRIVAEAKAGRVVIHDPVGLPAVTAVLAPLVP
jgi:hypothetical protein